MPQESRDPVSVVIPETLWEPHDDEEAVLAGWLAQDGAVVAEGDVIAEIMVDKVTMAVEAPAAGRLAIVTPADTPIRPGAVIGRIHRS